MRALALVLVLAGCHVERHDEARVEVTRQADTVATTRAATAVDVVVDRQEARTTGAVDTVRVEEVFGPPEQLPDGGANGPLVRRTTTTTHVAPSVSTSTEQAHAEAHIEAASATQTHAGETTKAEAHTDRTLDVGLSWPVKLAVLGGVALLLAVAWRLWRLVM